MGLEDSLANVRRSVDASRAQRFSGSIRQKAVRSLQKERKVSWKTLAVQVAAHACLHALPYGKGFGRSLAAAVQRWDSATGVADLHNARASKKRFGPSFVSISIWFLQVIWLFHFIALISNLHLDLQTRRRHVRNVHLNMNIQHFNAVAVRDWMRCCRPVLRSQA